MAIKRFLFDVETTGLDSKLCAIHQLSGRIEIDGEVREKFNFRLKPFKGALIEDDALNISGTTMEMLKSYPDQKTTYDGLLKILGRHCNKFDKKDKFTMVGFNNSAFDNQFMREFFIRNNDTYFGSWFWANTIDVYSIATLYLESERSKMTDFKLKTVAKYLGIVVDEALLHDADYDIHLTAEILKLTAPISIKV